MNRQKKADFAGLVCSLLAPQMKNYLQDKTLPVWIPLWYQNGKGLPPINAVTGQMYKSKNAALLAGANGEPVMTQSQGRKAGYRLKAGAKPFILFAQGLDGDGRTFEKPYRIYRISDFEAAVPDARPLKQPIHTEILQHRQDLIQRDVHQMILRTIHFYGIKLDRNPAETQPRFSALLNPDGSFSNPVIHLPTPDRFPSIQAYYSTFLHETGHSMMVIHPYTFKGSRDAIYAWNELRAQCFNILLANQTGLISDPLLHANDLSYCKLWLEKMTNNPAVAARLIQEAMNCAQRDVDLITENEDFIRKYKLHKTFLEQIEDLPGINDQEKEQLETLKMLEKEGVDITPMAHQLFRQIEQPDRLKRASMSAYLSRALSGGKKEEHEKEENQKKEITDP